MSKVWKDVIASIGLIVVAIIVVTMMTGFASDVESRWALASFAVFVVAGITGLLTGTTTLMKRAWSSVTMYVLFAALLVITITNAFINSEAWFVALGITVALLWVEYVGIDAFTHETTPPTHQQGAM